MPDRPLVYVKFHFTFVRNRSTLPKKWFSSRERPSHNVLTIDLYDVMKGRTLCEITLTVTLTSHHSFLPSLSLFSVRCVPVRFQYLVHFFLSRLESMAWKSPLTKVLCIYHLKHSAHLPTPLLFQ